MGLFKTEVLRFRECDRHVVVTVDSRSFPAEALRQGQSTYNTQQVPCPLLTVTIQNTVKQNSQSALKRSPTAISERMICLMTQLVRNKHQYASLSAPLSRLNACRCVPVPTSRNDPDETPSKSSCKPPV
jgi:hypothetical protein